MLLEVSKLDISYAKSSSPTVHDVSFNLDDGEILAIVGESGSGRVSSGSNTACALTNFSIDKEVNFLVA